MSAYEELAGSLGECNSAPLLFVGAGLSRRYLGVDGWVDMLRRMAEVTGKPYGYFASKADGDLPSVATEIAKAFHEVWWNELRFEQSRALFGDHLTSVQGPLKVEVARYVESCAETVPTDGVLAEELRLLGSAVVDGVITTNYDPLMERVFPDFKAFVGQDGLLFSDIQGVGEIYKIHGSCEEPESLVLCRADYERFNERNPYLAAKLLTLFVEHPVIFLGYSLQDENVSAVLNAVAHALTTENLSRLQGHLIFVNWDATVAVPTLVPTQIAVPGLPIPILLLTVPDFRGLFEVLSQLPRKFPARLLRQLKERVYELVLSKDPEASLAVVDIDDETRIRDVDVVFGVGVRRSLGERGYVGVTREDLLRDVVASVSDYEAMRIVEEALPRVLRAPGNIPVFRYLRQAGLLRDDGTLLPGVEVDSRVAVRMARNMAGFTVPETSMSRVSRLLSAAGGDLSTLMTSETAPDVLLAVLAWAPESLDLEQLRNYLQAHAPLVHSPTGSAWAKAVCMYDFYRYGVVGADAPPTRTRDEA